MNTGISETAWDWAAAWRDCAQAARGVIGDDPSEVEEIAQAAVSRAWMCQHQCRDQRARRAWVQRIARNEALRAVERRRRLAELGAAGEPCVEMDVEAMLERIDLERAVQALSVADRRLLHLRYTADLPHRAVAEHAGAPTATVKVRLHRLRRKLRTDLE